MPAKNSHRFSTVDAQNLSPISRFNSEKKKKALNFEFCMFHLERKVEKKNLSEVVSSFQSLCNTTKLESPSSEASASVIAPETYRSHLPVFHQLDGRRPKNLEIWNEDLGRNLGVWQSGPWCFWLFFGESPTVLRVPLEVESFFWLTAASLGLGFLWLQGRELQYQETLTPGQSLWQEFPTAVNSASPFAVGAPLVMKKENCWSGFIKASCG